MTIKYTFGNYTEPYHYDWVDVDGVGIDAPAYLLTGVLSGGDYQRNKQIVYQTTHFEKTEVPAVQVSLSSRVYGLYVQEDITAAIDPATGKEVLVLASLPPFSDYTTTEMSLVSGKLKSILVSYKPDPENTKVSMDLVGGNLKEQLIKLTVPPESTSASMDLVSGVLRAQLIKYTVPTESTQVSMNIISGVLSNG